MARQKVWMRKRKFPVYYVVKKYSTTKIGKLPKFQHFFEKYLKNIKLIGGKKHFKVYVLICFKN